MTLVERLRERAEWIARLGYPTAALDIHDAIARIEAADRVAARDGVSRERVQALVDYRALVREQDGG